MDRPRRSRNIAGSSGVSPMAVDSSTDSPSTSSSSRKRHSQRLEPGQPKKRKLSLAKIAPSEPSPEPSPVRRRRDSTAPRTPKTPVSAQRYRAKAISKAPIQDRIDEALSSPSLPSPPPPPPPTSLRINIVHSFGNFTTHEVPRSTKLIELFKLHYAEGGRKPCKGLALQQTGRAEVVNGSSYWKSGDGPTHRHFWDEGSKIRVQDTDWAFVSGEGWLACTFSRKRWQEERDDSEDEDEDGENEGSMEEGEEEGGEGVEEGGEEEGEEEQEEEEDEGEEEGEEEQEEEEDEGEEEGEEGEEEEEDEGEDGDEDEGEDEGEGDDEESD